MSYLLHRRKAFRSVVPSFGGNSRDFDGTNDYISLGDDDAFSFGDSSTDNAFSGAAWVKTDSAGNFIILSKDASAADREWNFRAIGGDITFFAVEPNTTGYIGRQYSTPLTYQVWEHVAFTYNGNSANSGVKIYKNGSQVDDADYSGGTYVAMHNTTAPFEIGRQAISSLHGDGKMADVRLYNKELTASEVSDLYNFTHVSDSLVGWWILDSDDVLDHSGNNYHGTNNGTTFSTDGPAD